MAEVRSGQQDLSHRMVVFGKKLIVGIHQFALSHRGCRLLGRYIGGSLLQGELTNPHTDRSRGDQNHLVTLIFQVGQYAAKQLHATDIQVSRGICQR